MNQEKNQLKVLKTRDFLKEIIAYPKTFKEDKELLKQLKSQGGLAKFECQERNIEPCALNTFKTNADEVINEGFDEIDKLRKNAVDALESEIKGKKSRKGNLNTHAGQKKRISDQKKEIEALQRENMLLTALLRESRSKMKTLAMYKGTEEQRWEVYLAANQQIQNACDLYFEGDI
ncbi:hypothetical protein [Vibrio parahaemolyticus]|uniref:hypothetical protein n=1 Tax=Vibrio parahaemolyticus TaxID=670 RepID=UPI00111D61BE|nr:hypothetical protein [Vibrio parahaemolyticus]QLE26006.1 hypothetical protein FDP11_10160 [Vibrio parahaemolyticus]TOQ48809.1 hypothetical protein CGG94_22490 [Vibrio parahaemolyticus]HBC3607000.1 hypothetical protein [Vibrio parahaemolyticus]HCE1882252.1 hypothetical protein [Vibrio parahaemolyticus]HCE3647390.1 hypothetical protein [Vibrio parahaemolyticus]